ncbi:hypothetical protein EDE04_5006 [Streptomyces sp. 2132.2]|uniref:hypothetical protein n=1 Tax=Streptomyces sp. 2132.2 TaxID=2485161 RepID=UPI000F46FE79|nr:hypothetical protein [Streptomyces sp. 2132.2]ROQ98471.1 hypothetical protein EDE04_5006 [Streptomyces sp. 2132.2]
MTRTLPPLPPGASPAGRRTGTSAPAGPGGPPRCGAAASRPSLPGTASGGEFRPGGARNAAQGPARLVPRTGAAGRGAVSVRVVGA